MATLETLWKPHPRVRVLREGTPDPDGTCVLYWMQRAQRGRDNAALNLAVALGNALKKPVIVAFGLTANYPEAQRRHYRFLLDGLANVEADLAAKNVPFVVRLGEPAEVILKLANELRPAAVVGDENPVRVGLGWRERVGKGLTCPFRLLDADVVVPSKLFPKDEWAARTLRIKIYKVWNDYLKPVPNPRADHSWPEGTLPKGEAIDPGRLLATLNVGGAGEVEGYVGGSAEAGRRLKRFLKERLPRYAAERNEPTPYQTSQLSAHLHFGHINPLTAALAVKESGEAPENIDAFLEELIVRRELAVNFVWRNPDTYDSLQGCPAWALKTLAEHRDDPRPVLYRLEQFEAGETHDPLWNAAQKEMVLTGRMHNYLRMYWAKKMLEWSPDPETAFAWTLLLNDRYEMDGRDPNGYEGVAWAVGGKHDRPWPARPIFGTVRFMSYESTRRKFDSAAYIERVKRIESGAERASG